MESRHRSKFQKDLQLVEDLQQMLKDECEDVKHAMKVSQDRDQYSAERNPKNLALKLPAKKKTYRLVGFGALGSGPVGLWASVLRVLGLRGRASPVVRDLEGLIDRKSTCICMEGEQKTIEKNHRHCTLLGPRPDLPVLGSLVGHEDSTLRSELIRIHQEKKDSVIPAIPEVEETDELLPEVAAAIMHTEEQGIHLGMTPRRMFDHLFPAPSGRDEPLLPVSFIAPSQPLELSSSYTTNHAFWRKIHDATISESKVHQCEALPNVVIPLGTPGFNVAVEDAAIIASAVDDNVAQPKESIFSESFTEQTVKPKHDITSTDPRTIEYYVGGSISSTTTSSTSSDHWENVEAMQDKDRQEFLHMAETQSHFSQIQLRGTKPPPWFPGHAGRLGFLELRKMQCTQEGSMLSPGKRHYGQLVSDKMTQRAEVIEDLKRTRDPIIREIGYW
uniref:(California timema) hypothetical protein n=1 Tax=Timema californicum TaxID=61474 RepID=A0A7R9PB31_TIMCA|nr:unnamed protein product [Timema californicum]